MFEALFILTTIDDAVAVAIRLTVIGNAIVIAVANSDDITRRVRDAIIVAIGAFLLRVANSVEVTIESGVQNFDLTRKLVGKIKETVSVGVHIPDSASEAGGDHAVREALDSLRTPDGSMAVRKP